VRDRRDRRRGQLPGVVADRQLPAVVPVRRSRRRVRVAAHRHTGAQDEGPVAYGHHARLRRGQFGVVVAAVVATGRRRESGPAGLAATQLGWLLLILYLPGGIAQGIEPLRNRYAGWAARRHGLDMATESAAAATGGEGPDLFAVAAHAPSLVAPGEPLLEAS